MNLMGNFALAILSRILAGVCHEDDVGETNHVMLQFLNILVIFVLYQQNSASVFTLLKMQKIKII